ncbi:Methylase/methyltransferase [Smithella sp. ME-1]|nr:Methylase/methyltransferase [Smithella sp. ME-1]
MVLKMQPQIFTENNLINNSSRIKVFLPMEVEEETVEVDCDLCGERNRQVLFVKEGFPRCRCTNCGLVYVSPRLKRHLELQKHYGTGTMGEERLTPQQVKRLKRAVAGIEPWRQLNRFLDIGPGRGWYLSATAEAGWETWAVEINSRALSYLKKLVSSHIIAAPAEEFESQENFFDVVRLFDVIEHLTSPRRVVERIFRSLRPGGLLELSTTNFASLSMMINGPQWMYLNGTDHIILFDQHTMNRLLTQVGFQNIQISTRDFHLKRRFYHPERELPPGSTILRPFRKLIDETIFLTAYGHQLLVRAIKPSA